MKKTFIILALASCLQAQAGQQKFTGTRNGWAPWSGQDKAEHFAVGLVYGMVTENINEGLGVKHPLLLTIFESFLLGMCKEWYDRRHHGSPEYADTFNTGLGGTFAALAVHWKRKSNARRMADLPTSVPPLDPPRPPLNVAGPCWRLEPSYLHGELR